MNATLVVIRVVGVLLLSNPAAFLGFVLGLIVGLHPPTSALLAANFAMATLLILLPK